VAGVPPPLPLHCAAKVRYRQQDQSCTLSHSSEQGYRVDFEIPQRAITPGQSVVFYQDACCLGGGVIERTGS
jgi:tRNA-uridine 2-sulfurtransferase